MEPKVARAVWYGLRGWIEQGFKRVKGEGWKLPRTRITSCARLERLWFAVAVATLWVLEGGGDAEVEEEEKKKAKKVGEDTPALPDLEEQDKEAQPSVEEKPAEKKPAKAKAGRTWSVFARGWQVLRDALAAGVLLLGSWHPEPWPDQPALGLPPTPAVGAANPAVPGLSTQPPSTCSSPGIHECDSS